MKTILVPVGFTDDSTNAAKYAIQLGLQLGYSKVVLYNVFEIPVSPNPDPMGTFVGPMPIFDIEDYKKISEGGLDRLKTELQAIAPLIEIDTISEMGDLTGYFIDDLSKKIGSDLVVMGISSGDFIDETLIGSNAVHVAKNTTQPVIAVPANTIFKPYSKIVLACDFKKVAETVPSASIKKLLDATKAQFYVLHIGEDSENQSIENLTLHHLFEDYKPEFHFINNPDFTEAINEFVEEKGIDLIITIPKKHGWLEGLFKRSHTKALAFHSHIPLLMIHD